MVRSSLGRTHVLEYGLVDNAVLDSGPFEASWWSPEVLGGDQVIDQSYEWDQKEYGHIADLVSPQIVDLEIGPKGPKDAWKEYDCRDNEGDGAEGQDHPQ
jgi:hypothetical protein